MSRIATKSGNREHAGARALLLELCVGSEVATTMLLVALGQSGEFSWSQAEWMPGTGLGRSEQESARRVLRTLPFWSEVRYVIPARLFFRVEVLPLLEAIALAGARWDAAKQQGGAAK